MKAAITQGTLRAFVDDANVAATGQRPGSRLETERVEDDSLHGDPVRHPRPAGLGGRDERQLRRGRDAAGLAAVQAAAPAPARAGPELAPWWAPGSSVTIGIALVQMAIFLGLGAAAFGLQLTGAWWAAIPLLVVGTLCFMAVGLLAGSIARTTEGAVNMANFIVLPMAFLSGSFFPLDAAPAVAADGLAAAAAAPPQRGHARRDGARRALDRGAAADGDPGRLRRRRDRRRRPAVPLGDPLTRAGHIMATAAATPATTTRARRTRSGIRRPILAPT